MDQQRRVAVKFQATILLCYTAAVVVVWLLNSIWIGKLFFWLPMLVSVVQVGGIIVGAIKAYDGENFQFPLILRFV